MWLSPVQVAVLSISEKTNEYAAKVAQQLKEAGLRVEANLGSEKIGAKIRTATLEKVPYMLVVGEKEAAAGTVAVRDRVAGDLGALALTELVTRLQQEVRERTIRQTSTATAGLTEGGAKFGE